jgi:8-amino-7-oxononanoate synthase
MKEAEPLEFVGKNHVRFRNRPLVYFSGCDYFRLARNPKLFAAAKRALKNFGLNVAASRATTGNHKIYAQLEIELAKFFGAETAIVLPDGYFAPLAVAQALAGEFSHTLIDERAHGALFDAAQMLDCPLRKFKHRDVTGLKKLLANRGKNFRPIILTDGMFAHDGSVAPLHEYLKFLTVSGKILVDDAHGAGILGATGKGTLEFENVGRGQIIQCATLSKAFGAYGGVILASQKLREKILSRSRVFIGTTPLPLPLAGAALAALKILPNDSQRRKKLFQNLKFVREYLRPANWEISETPGPIIRLPQMSEKENDKLKKNLFAANIFPPFIKYFNASGAFRFVISSEHSRAQLENLILVLTKFKSAEKFVGDKEIVRTK